MKLLIDTIRTGETIEVDLEDVSTCYPIEGKIYFNIVACDLFTARSLEVEAIKEAVELFRDIMKRNDIADGAESIDTWLEQWDSE